MKHLAWFALALLLMQASLASTHDKYSEPRAGFSAGSSITVDDTAVYNTGYVSENGSEWTSFDLTGETNIRNWILGTASSDISLDNVGYVAIYSCNWTGTWDCSETWQVHDRGIQQSPAEDENQTNTSVPGPGSLQADYDALQDLYSSTTGDGWWDNTGWESMTPETMGDAYGITVYPNGHEHAGRVKEINLLQNNLIGTIPESIGDLRQLTYLNLKQPLTLEEFEASEPDGVFATNPPTKLTGPIPASIGNMTSLKWLSLGGQHREIVPPDEDYAWNEANHGSGHGEGKRYVQGNRLSGPLPPEIGNLRNLEILEIRRQELSGPIPPEIGQLESVIGIYLNGKADYTDSTVSSLEGEIPDELYDLTQLQDLHIKSNKLTGTLSPRLNELTNLKNIRISRNFLTGEIPVLDKLTDLYVFRLQRNDFSSRFPAELFQDGRNPRMDNFALDFNDFEGSQLDPDLNMSFYTGISIFSINGAGFSGSLPNWTTQLNQFEHVNLGWNNFEGELPPGFFDADAPIYNLPRNFRLNSNQFTGELPDVPFVQVAFEGVVEQQPADNQITLDLQLDTVESGTVVNAQPEWMQDTTKRGEWEEPWLDHFVTVDPGGRNIVFDVLEDSNYEAGTLYSRDRADLSGTEGLTYTIRPIVEGRVIRFKLAHNRYIARKIADVDYQTDTVTLDKPLGQDVDGLEYTIHERKSPVLVNNWNYNHFTGPIPQSWEYIPTDRAIKVRVRTNDLSGPIPDLSRVGEDQGGSLDRLEYQENRFVFRDILPHFDAHEAAANDHTYAPQKAFGPEPWGEQKTLSVSQGGTLSYDELTQYVSHPDNSYQWQKDGSDVPGATTRELTITDAQQSDEGDYQLQVSNSQLPDLTLYSEDIRVTVN